MSKFATDLMESLGDAVAHAKGEASGVRVNVVHVPDVRAIRENLHMTQNQFAAAYGIPIATLKGWEQGRRHPDATAAAYLSVIARLPREAKAALGK
jgi:putative transcriptional regulator